MSVHISARAWSVKGLSFAEKLVLVRLADMANDEGTCYPSFGRLAADLEIDVRSARRIAARLEAKGLLTREKRFRRDNGSQASNLFTVLPPDDRRPCDADFEVVSTPRTGRSSPRTGESSPPDRAVLPPLTGESSLGMTGESSLESSLNRQINLRARDVCEARPAAVFPVDPASITACARHYLLDGKPWSFGDVRVQPDAPEWSAFMLAVRAQDAENRQVRDAR